jgi:hypothetical protein
MILEIEAEPVDHGSPERAMWCAALALLLSDARHHHRTGVDMSGAVPGTGSRALRDVTRQGEMVTRLCNMADQDVDWVCRKFAKSLYQLGPLLNK